MFFYGIKAYPKDKQQVTTMAPALSRRKREVFIMFILICFSVFLCGYFNRKEHKGSRKERKEKALYGNGFCSPFFDA